MTAAPPVSPTHNGGPVPDHTAPPRSEPANGWLDQLDRFAAANPWHARVLPFVVYIAFLFVIDLARGVSLYTYPLLYAIQCGVVAWLLWRFKRQGLLPELNIRFHWLAIPIGLGLTWAWIELGQLTIHLWPRLDGAGPDKDPHYFQTMLELDPALGWASLVLRFLGMSLLVPLFEELFVRSAVLRGMHRPRDTGIAFVQLAEDMPLIGDAVSNTALGARAAAEPPLFTKQLMETPVGRLSIFGVVASTAVFTINHGMRDWLGCIACGVAWCALLWWTNRGALANPATPDAKPRLGLGPIVWSHGVCNAALWAYCVYTGDWQWM